MTPEQVAVVDELKVVLAHFATVLESCREHDLRVVDAFRAAGVEIPAFVPAGLLEGLLAPA